MTDAEIIIQRNSFLKDEQSDKTSNRTWSTKALFDLTVKITVDIKQQMI